MNTTQIIIDLIGYAYFAFALQSLASKTNTPDGWLAWIPVAQLYLLVKIARKPMSWFYGIVVPFALVIGSLLLYIVFREVVIIRWILAIIFGAGAIGMIAAGILILMAWYEIIKNFGKPTWTIILFLIPLVNLIYIGYLAFAPSVVVVPVTTAPTTPPTQA